MSLPENFADAVRVLGGQESQRLHELPATVFKLDVLKGLDHRGLVKIHLWDREPDPQSPFVRPGQPKFVLRRVTADYWFSPVADPNHVGSWEDILKAYPGERSPEIRLTKEGLDEFDALGGGKAKPPGESKQTRAIDEARAYELINDENKTLAQAGIVLADEQGRKKPYTSEAVRLAAERHAVTRAKEGLGAKPCSVSLRNAYPLRDDDGASS